MGPQKEVLDVEEAAALLSISAYSARELARDGKIPARKIGGVWRFSRRALLAYLEGDFGRAAKREEEDQ